MERKRGQSMELNPSKCKAGEKKHALIQQVIRPLKSLLGLLMKVFKVLSIKRDRTFSWTERIPRSASVISHLDHSAHYFCPVFIASLQTGFFAWVFYPTSRHCIGPFLHFLWLLLVTLGIRRLAWVITSMVSISSFSSLVKKKAKVFIY